MTQENLSITLRDLQPSDPVRPLSFISAASVGSKGIVSNVSIEPVAGGAPSCKRVTCTVTIPVEVIYADANGVEGRGFGELTYLKDVVLNAPENSVFPTEIAATVNMVSPFGVYAQDNTFVITCCVTIILTAETDALMLVPSYGYSYIPPCQEFTQEVCTGVFDLPLFPQ
jgi:hypothetical protein